MATSITNTSLTVTINEAIQLNGQPINSENKLIISDVNEYDKRIMTLPTGSEVTIVAFATQVAAGTFVRNNMKYFRITNKDTVNYFRVRVKKNGSDAFDVRVNAGQSFMMGNSLINASESAAAFVTFDEADSISGQAYDGNIDVEYVVAST
jgi:hypothetical protein